VKRALAVAVALAAALAIVYALRPAARGPRGAAGDVARPHADIDDASRAQLERVLRESAREDATPKDGSR
jgi:hypothetical protein